MIDLPLILIAALLASASPGPATLAIAGTSMARGRGAGLALAAGITTGSLMWSISAAAGLGALMLAHGWVLEVIRYVGAGYLLWLAYKSARAAWRPATLKTAEVAGSKRKLFAKGLALHVTNPKAVLFFGALYAVGVPADAGWQALATVIVAVGIQSLVVFHGYALLFSTPAMTRGYIKLRRWFEAVFALGFGAAGLKILTTRLS